MPFSLPIHRVYVIADIGVNHDGNAAKARHLVDVAVAAKVDAVKFQLFNADELASSTAPLAVYQERSGEENQHAMLKRLTLPLDDYRHLKKYAEGKGLDFITTPYDITAAHFLAGLGVKAIKIPSGEITNLPFLREVALLKTFTIISTGMSSIEEIRDAIASFDQMQTPYALLHCVSAYPAPANEINLRAMETMRDAFNVPVGYSDHTTGGDVALAAAALGAEIIEKHFTIHRSDPGPDHAASLEPDELTAMVKGIRIVEKALGSAVKCCQPCEINTRDVARRSVVLVQSVKAGTVLTAEMLALKRPGTGVAPARLPDILGKTVTKNINADMMLTDDMLQ